MDKVLKKRTLSISFLFLVSKKSGAIIVSANQEKTAGVQEVTQTPDMSFKTVRAQCHTVQDSL